MLRKQEIGAMWTRFIHSPLKQPWLTRDFNYCLVNYVSDDEEKLEPSVDPSRKQILKSKSKLFPTYPFFHLEYAFEVDQSETSSSDSDEECADEKWLRDDD